MAEIEYWVVQDSARTMTRKFNAVVDAIRQTDSTSVATEPSGVVIKDDTDEDIDAILKDEIH